MSQWMDRKTLGYTQMGGEGANWIGEAPFSNRGHVFQNLGDGTYNHSGYLAIRAAIASGVTMTYKILFNDAVAMTGGQANDGGLNVPRSPARSPPKAPSAWSWSPTSRGNIRTTPTGRAASPSITATSSTLVQRELATVPGVSILIYDQTCAAEKRRRRKRGTFPDPDKRVVINDLVCEGCGDCGVKSNCVSVQPLMTEWGRKRTIDQSSCNKDYSCVKGFCPSFVTVHGAKLKHGESVAEPADWPALPAPSIPLDQPSLRHHRHRRRRHRHRHHRRHHRHGRQSRGQGRRHHRHGRPRAEGRRGLQPYPHRQYGRRTSTPFASPPAAPIWSSAAISSWSAARRCSARSSRATRASSSTRSNSCPAISPATPTFRCRPSGSSAPSPAMPAASGAISSMPTGLRPTLLGRSIGANMFMLGYAYQTRRLAAFGGGDRKGDRAERRGGGDEHRRLPLRPPRGGRSGGGRGAGQAAAGTGKRFAQALAIVRRDGRAPRRLPHRLSERALCAALPQLGREDARGRKRKRCPANAGWRKRWRAICSS